MTETAKSSWLAAKKKKFIKTILSNKAMTNPLGEDIYRELAPYDFGTPLGKKIYESMSNGEMEAYLRILAKKLNHSPSRKEVPQVVVQYIKARYSKWPYALRASGLSKSAGSGGKTMESIEEDWKERDRLFQLMRERSLSKGKIAHPRDMRDAIEDVKKFYNSWGDFVLGSGVEKYLDKELPLYKVENISNKGKKALQDIMRFAKKHGRSPFHNEVDIKTRKLLISECGSWRNALYQIGLTPVKKIKAFDNHYLDYRMATNPKTHSSNIEGCNYNLLFLEEADRNTLIKLRNFYIEEGKEPRKNLISKEEYKRLINTCGSWKNVLYQAKPKK